MVKAQIGESLTPEELGGARVHASVSGVVHVLAEGDEDCINKGKELVSFLPPNNREKTPFVKRGDDHGRLCPRLDDIVPTNPKKIYDMHKVIEEIVDNGNFFEIHRHYCKNMIIGFARFDVHSVGIVSTNPAVYAGTITEASARKKARFVRFCDLFNIPLIYLVDSPAYLIGSQQERAGVISRGTALIFATVEAIVPKITVDIRKSGAASSLAMGSLTLRGDVTFAWVTADLSTLTAQNFAEVIYAREIRKAANPEEVIKSRTAECEKDRGDIYDAASWQNVNDIIEPAETRIAIIRGLDMRKNKVQEPPKKRYSNIPLKIPMAVPWHLKSTLWEGEKIIMNSLYAKTIYTGKSIAQNAYLIFNGQKINGVSNTQKGKLLGKFAVLTPAFIDPHSHISMARAGEPANEMEANDHLDSVLALADALDSVQMDDPALQDAVEMGVLYSCILPGSGNIIGGLSAVIRNYAKNSTEALVARSGIKAALGYNPISTQGWKGKRPSTRMGVISILRNRFHEVLQKAEQQRKAKGKKRDDIFFSAEDAVLRDVLAGKTRLRAHVHKIDDIAVLLRIVDEFKIKVSVDHAMDVHHPEIFRELKKRKIPVIYGPVDAFAYKVELKHENWRNIRHLLESGVDYGLMTDHPVTPARQIFLGTRWFTRAGISKQQAIELVSRKNAEVLGVNRFLGTLERGKWASFICWNKDPFDLTSFPVAVYGEGELLFNE